MFAFVDDGAYVTIHTVNDIGRQTKEGQTNDKCCVTIDSNAGKQMFDGEKFKLRKCSSFFVVVGGCRRFFLNVQNHTHKKHPHTESIQI